MKLDMFARRFLIPSSLVSLICYLKYRALVSPRAEVELSPLLHLSRGVNIGSFTKIKAAVGLLKIGVEVRIGSNCFIAAQQGGIEIGDYSMIGPNSTILSNMYKYDRLDIPILHQGVTSKGTRIGSNVFIGSNCVILDGAHIGSGVIVSSGSVVSGRIPDNVIIQGNPAKVVFERR
ncbi:MAG: acyltransferase [Gammaproteobacteria bacterium]|nr:acyltransferase [Gammaproteobacteria bacterium]